MDNQVSDLLLDYEDFEDQMRDMFKAMLAFDADKSGKLSKDELHQFLSAAGFGEGVAESFLEELLEELVTGADENGDGELDFQEFIICYNKLLDYRTQHGLPQLDVEAVVSLHLETFYGNEDIKARKESKIAEGTKSWKIVTIMGEQASVNILVEIFKLAEPDSDGKVTGKDLFEQMINVGYVSEGGDLSRIKTVEGLVQLDVMQTCKLVHPKISNVKLVLLIDNARRYLKKQEENKRSKDAKCQLYLDIKKNRKLLTEEIKLEAMNIFAAYDHDQDKNLSCDEFVEAVEELYDTETACNIFDLVDTDRSGGINTWEFVAFWVMGVKAALDAADCYDQHLLGVLDGLHQESDLNLLLRENAAIDEVAQRRKQRISDLKHPDDEVAQRKQRNLKLVHSPARDRW